MVRITERCTTCGACMKRCPKNAISFQKVGIHDVAVIDEKKCIKCGKCYKICPSNNEQKENNVTIKVARIKNKEDIKKSTSGGIFGELARFILNQGGIVYGAAFTDDFKKVHHVRCDNIDDLTPILKSKYVRSDLEDTFKEAEQDLKQNKIVLFSGTPCQIAGLKKYLQKDYTNLYTIDIICHGAPSSSLWKKYVNLLEKTAKEKIKSIDFRNLDSEDPQKNFKIQFKNNKVYKEAFYDTSYGRGFCLGLINGESCGNCPFNDFKNYSDMTIGDAWGYTNKEYPNKNSIIIINNNYGEKLYSFIQNELIEFKDYKVENLFIHNYPLIYSTLNHINHNRINLDAKNIDKELWYWLDDKNALTKDEKGVGILDFPYENINFGANLVPYSLSKIIERLGYNPHVIDFDVYKEPDAIAKYQSINFYKFREKYLNMTPKFKESKDLKILDTCYDMFITGSDQVWRKLITKNNYSSYFLDFIKNKNKISYGASFGSDQYDGDIVDQLNAIANISSFYKVSVRENSGVDICKNKLLRDDAEVVLDPTLLLTADDYAQINDDAYDEKVDVAVYLMLDATNEEFYNKQFKRLFPNKKIVNIKGDFIKKPFGNVFVYNHIAKWIDGIRKSKYVVTDSYHGLVFSIIFHKNIICLGNKSSSYSRFATLIENLGGNIDKIMFDSLKDVKNLQTVTNVLDFDTIDKNIREYKKKSIDFLEENLKTENIKEENILFSDLAKKASKLREDNNNSKNAQEELYSVLNSKTWRITEPLRAMKRNISKIGKNEKESDK